MLQKIDEEVQMVRLGEAAKSFMFFPSRTLDLQSGSPPNSRVFFFYVFIEISLNSQDASTGNYVQMRLYKIEMIKCL